MKLWRLTRKRIIIAIQILTYLILLVSVLYLNGLLFFVSKTHLIYFVECFDPSMNLFEQFCINYANEKIQNFSTHRLICEEQEWYKAEGLDLPKIVFPGNDEVLSEYICIRCKFMFAVSNFH